MPDAERPDSVTQLLDELARSKEERGPLWEKLAEIVYGDLRHVAANLMRGERSSHTLQPTAVVHEAYLRLVDQNRTDWKGREQFFAVAAQAMRRVLVDHARKRATAKRGGAMQRVTLNEGVVGKTSTDVKLLDLNDALAGLARLDERMTRVVELKVFTGLTMPEIADVLGVSKRTVDGDWSVAKKWLRRELDGP